MVWMDSNNNRGRDCSVNTLTSPSVKQRGAQINSGDCDPEDRRHQIRSVGGKCSQLATKISWNAIGPRRAINETIVTSTPGASNSPPANRSKIPPVVPSDHMHRAEVRAPLLASQSQLIHRCHKGIPDHRIRRRESASSFHTLDNSQPAQPQRRRAMTRAGALSGLPRLQSAGSCAVESC